MKRGLQGKWSLDLTVRDDYDNRLWDFDEPDKRRRARQMVDLLGVSNAADLAVLTERDMEKLSDLRGWSPRLVEGIGNTASRAVRRRS